MDDTELIASRHRDNTNKDIAEMQARNDLAIAQIHAEASGTRASFAGTIAFGLLTLLGLLAASIAAWIFAGSGYGHTAVLMSLFACACAYLAQFAYTRDWFNLGLVLQLACLIAALGAFLFLCWAT